MREIRYEMRSTEPDPIDSGNMAGWFYHYKWKGEEGEEKFVPRMQPQDWLRPEPGDALVFVMDGRVIGRTAVLRVDYPGGSRGREEIWYDSSKIEEPEAPGSLLLAPAPWRG